MLVDLSRDIRVGTIGRKIGIYPLWDKNGVRVLTTLIQVQFVEITSFPPRELAQVISEFYNQPLDNRYLVSSLRLLQIRLLIPSTHVVQAMIIIVADVCVQLVDNHVLQYIPPENFQFNIRYRNRWQKMDPDPSRSYARMVVGAGHVNPLNINARYLNLFNQAGVLPKARVMSFIITDNAKLPPGRHHTLLF
ncbi:MRPL3 [Cordylochernes scorpioides]|uniref:MRPL3 n=1 Tax=Cordylochernes scorpioides TaxID=51811 RepID=A0ABY6LIF6_9ARAC|nr:MRPL3 [Cordylochernes scorpioides]